MNTGDSISVKTGQTGETGDTGQTVFQGGFPGGKPGETPAPPVHFANGAYTFAKLFCRIHRCRAEDIEEHVLWHSLYHTATIPLAWLVMKYDPDFFRADLQMIAEIKTATTHAQVREILADHHTQFLKKSFLRNRLKLRVSRTKLISLARTVLRSEF